MRRGFRLAGLAFCLNVASVIPTFYILNYNNQETNNAKTVAGGGMR